MGNRVSRPEHVAKFAVLKHLQRSSKLRDAIVASEVVLRRSAVRADLLLLNEDTPVIFEIKTEQDSLRRLRTQVHACLRHFPLFILVVHRKHLISAKKLVPRNAGVWFFDGTEISEERPARKRLPAKKDLVGLLPIHILRRLCGLNSEAVRGFRRADLEKKAATLPHNILTKSVAEMYRAKFARFSEEVVRIVSSSEPNTSSPEMTGLFVRSRRGIETRGGQAAVYEEWLEDWGISQSTQASSNSSVTRPLSE